MPEDVSEGYVNWFSDQAASQYISAAASRPDINALREYVRERIGRNDLVFLGIFEKKSGLHIGNIKFEPIDVIEGYAIMGLLVGESSWRGQGVATEVIKASAEWLSLHMNISQIVLGVSRDNVAAIRAYEKAGFVQETTKLITSLSNDNMSMVLHANVRQS